jgi:hypothetical protein
MMACRTFVSADKQIKELSNLGVMVTKNGVLNANGRDTIINVGQNVLEMSIRVCSSNTIH